MNIYIYILPVRVLEELSLLKTVKVRKIFTNGVVIGKLMNFHNCQKFYFNIYKIYDSKKCFEHHLIILIIIIENLHIICFKRKYSGRSVSMEFLFLRWYQCEVGLIRIDCSKRRNLSISYYLFLFFLASATSLYESLCYGVCMYLCVC